MPGKNEPDGDARELEHKGADDIEVQFSEEEILALIKSHPELQRYIDRRVTEGIKTFAANQKKKAADLLDKPTDDGGEEEGGESQAPEGESKPAGDMAEQGMDSEHEISLKSELSKRGLDCFAGLVESAEQIDTLECAAAEFLRTQNLGADFAPFMQTESGPELSPLEAHVAQRLGIDAKGYANRKQELSK